MKAFAAFFVGIFLLCAVAALPAKDPNQDAETITVPPAHQPKPEMKPNEPTPNFDDFDGVIISDIQPSFFAYRPVFPYAYNYDFLSRFQEMLRTLRDSAWSYAPSIGSGGDDSKWLTDLSKDADRNETSKVEVIDGHKVITNDTVITKKTEFGDAVISIRVVDIEPLSSGESGENVTPGSPNAPNVPNSPHSPIIPSRAPGKSNDDAENYSPEVYDPTSRDNEIPNEQKVGKLQAGKH